MKKDLTIRGKGNLSKAREEYEQFKSKQITRSAEKHAKSQALVDPEKANAILLCSINPGAAAQMEFDLTPENARLIKAVAIQPTNKMASGSRANNITLNRTLAISNTYEGCPHCAQRGIVHCTCGALCCITDTSLQHTCPSCGLTSNLVPMREPISVSGTRSTGKAKIMLPKNTTKAMKHEPRLLLTRKNRGEP